MRDATTMWVMEGKEEAMSRVLQCTHLEKNVALSSDDCVRYTGTVQSHPVVIELNPSTVSFSVLNLTYEQTAELTRGVHDLLADL